jgi:hypothetical protein
LACWLALLLLREQELRWLREQELLLDSMCYPLRLA